MVDFFNKPEPPMTRAQTHILASSVLAATFLFDSNIAIFIVGTVWLVTLGLALYEWFK